MSVYVDKNRLPFRGMIMCHMLGDTISELHAMADRLALKRSWFQNKKTPHYDICLKKRYLAIKYGAIEINRRETVALIQKLKNESRGDAISMNE